MKLDPSVAVRRRHLPSKAGEENEKASLNECSPVELGRAFELTVSLAFPKLAAANDKGKIALACDVENRGGMTTAPSHGQGER